MSNLSTEQEYYNVFSKGTAIAGLIDEQRKRYGEKLMRKNPYTNLYRCFYCNKDLRANISRHIARHEIDGDAINEEVRDALLNDRPLPPAVDEASDSRRRSSMAAFSSKSTETIQWSGGLTVAGVDVGSAPVYTPQEAEFLPHQRKFEVELSTQLLLHMAQTIVPSQLAQRPVVRTLFRRMDEKSVSSSFSPLYSFLLAVQQTAKNILAQQHHTPSTAPTAAAARSADVTALTEAIGVFKTAYRLYVAKEQLVQSSAAFMQCSVCGLPPSSPRDLLLPCVGQCLERFHARCIRGKSLPNKPHLSGKALLCSGCERGDKVLHWDADVGMFFFYRFTMDEPPAELPAVKSSGVVNAAALKDSASPPVSSPAEIDVHVTEGMNRRQIVLRKGEPRAEEVEKNAPDVSQALPLLPLLNQKKPKTPTEAELAELCRRDAQARKQEMLQDAALSLTRPKNKTAALAQSKRHALLHQSLHQSMRTSGGVVK